MRGGFGELRLRTARPNAAQEKSVEGVNACARMRGKERDQREAAGLTETAGNSKTRRRDGWTPSRNFSGLGASRAWRPRGKRRGEQGLYGSANGTSNGWLNRRESMDWIRRRNGRRERNGRVTSSWHHFSFSFFFYFLLNYFVKIFCLEHQKNMK